MLSELDKQAIQQAYSSFLSARGWQARHGQKQMIAVIANSLASIEMDAEGNRASGSGLSVIEAGTGTGKTIAYCLASIPMARSLGKSLVISTATVALQEQIVFKDLPDLKRDTDLSFDFALAKGRARYICPARLDGMLEGNMDEVAIALYPDEESPSGSPSAMALYQTFLNAMAAGEWDGDRDAWPEHIEQGDWQKVTTDHHQCAGRRCAYISQCPFFRARDRIAGVDIVVANHDLVLADLSLGGGAILPAPEQTIYIFDEAHHLPEKAINHFSVHTRVEGSKKWLKQIEKNISTMGKSMDAVSSIRESVEKLEKILAALKETTDSLQELLSTEIAFPEQEDEQRRGQISTRPRRFRFSKGMVPDFLQDCSQQLTRDYGLLEQLLEAMGEGLKQQLDMDAPDIPRHDLEQWYPVAGAMLARCEAIRSLWFHYANRDLENVPPNARWITLRDDASVAGGMDFELCCSPIQSADMLAENLWKRCFSAVLTSATLTALGSFERFQLRCGTSADDVYLTIPSPFPFQNSTLEIPDVGVEPSDVAGHTEAIEKFIETSIEENSNRIDNGGEASGMLVLFSSRKQMEEVFFGVDKPLRDVILMQGDLSKQEMVNRHKKCIDRGHFSVLFGLASFAEGVDLPGVYCKHVVIAKLPFSVPDDPVEEALSEWVENNGGNAFMDISVPDAAMKLVQACGRLLRSEEDSGTITLLDRRIVSKRYGKAILEALPPYRRVIA